MKISRKMYERCCVKDVEEGMRGKFSSWSLAYQEFFVRVGAQ